MTLVIFMLLVAPVSPLLYEEFSRRYDFSPLVPIDVILNEMKSNDSHARWEAVRQLGRHGIKAAPFLPELHDLYNKNHDEYEDPILAKAISDCLSKILVGQTKADEIENSWGNEWVLAHPAEAAKRGYKVTP